MSEPEVQPSEAFYRREFAAAREQMANTPTWLGGELNVDELRQQLAAALARAEELQALFDLQWTRTVEADRLWREAHPGNDLVSPDLAVLIEWLVARAEQAEQERDRLREALEAIEKGEGRFSRDHLTHCENTVEDMRRLARRALAGSTDDAAAVGGGE